jgi:single-strand DNA-binding protein
VSNVNLAAFSGNLVADLETKVVKLGDGSDFTIANGRVAVNKSVKAKDGSGGYEEKVSYLDITILGKFADLCDRKLRKADKVTVSAEIEQQRWENNEGEKRSKVVFVVKDIDSPALFLKDEEVKPKTDGSDGTSTGGNLEAANAAAPADDDIPF